MSLYRRAAKRDANEREIFDTLEACGCSILPISHKGAPDALVFTPRGKVWLVEVKSKTGKLTEHQVAWRARWSGPPPVIVRSVEDALALVKRK